MNKAAGAGERFCRGRRIALTVIRNILITTGISSMSQASPSHALASTAEELSGMTLTLSTPSGTYKVPALYLDSRPNINDCNTTKYTESWGFMFWNSDGAPPLQDPVAIAGLRPIEAGRSPEDFLVSIKSVRLLTGNPNYPVPVSNQLINILRNTSDGLVYNNDFGYLHISFGENPESASYWYKENSLLNASPVFSFLMRQTEPRRSQALNDLIDGSVELPELGIETYIQIPRRELANIEHIIKDTSAMINRWRINSDVHN